MPRLLLTRPEEDCIGLRDALQKMQIDSVIAPMLRIENIPGPEISTDGLQGFLVTSANGVRALALRTENRDLPLFAVGDATARAAFECGFGTITSAAGDVTDLATLVIHACDADAGRFYHAAGTVTAGDLSGRLSEHGFQVIREQIYEAKTVETLPENAEAALSTGQLDGVVIYSPRTAKTFTELVDRADLTSALRKNTLFALSENVSNAAGNAWEKVVIASAPTQESLLNTIRTCYY